MQAEGIEGAPIGKEKAMPEATPEESKEQASDGWDAFYSMPPSWKKSDKTQPASERAERTERPATERTERNWSPKTPLTDENIGHKLASLLRYHIDENDIDADDDGWVMVSQILEHADAAGLYGCTEEDLLRVGRNNEHGTRGKRFDTDVEGGRIRATYRHPPKGERYHNRSRRPRGYGGGWQGWNDWQGGRWGESEWQEWEKGTWSKPGFSPSPDGEGASWESAKDSTSPAASTAASSGNETAATEAQDTRTLKEQCEWEQWYTPEMEMYFYNTKTEEFFFPSDEADITEKGWARYLDSEAGDNGKVYWWHDATGRSFYEDDVAGPEDTEA